MCQAVPGAVLAALMLGACSAGDAAEDATVAAPGSDAGGAGPDASDGALAPDSGAGQATDTGTGAGDAASDGSVAAGDAASVPNDSSVAAADAGSAQPHRFDIRFDYRFDSHGFFADQGRRKVLEAAADVWRNLLRDDFATIPAGTPLLLHNLVDMDADPIELTLAEPIDDLLIFLACSPDLDVEGVAGRTRRIANFPGAMGAAFQQMLMDRWRGADQEPWAVGITFACNMPFFVDATPETKDDVAAATQIDLMNTAMHEIGHALGFGASNTYEALRSSDKKTFLGAKASALYGGPVPLAPDGAHMVDDLMFAGSRVLMDFDTKPGERDYPTALDLAVFEDLGYKLAR